jgi:protein-L-isoaspartate(D-aspartate) O-methyltransferase
MEHVASLTAWSRDNMLRALPHVAPAWLDSGRVELVTADGRLGLPRAGPFDVIHVGAASPGPPHELLTQLKPGGRLVAPVGSTSEDQELLAYDKAQDGTVTSRMLLDVRFVPLCSLVDQLS